MQVKVKICGITNQEDAIASIEAGADAIGINLYPKSKRYVDWKRADWISTLPSTIIKVAVLVNLPDEDLIAIRNSSLFDSFQFHGDETPDFCSQYGGDHYIRAWSAINADHLQEMLAYNTTYFLLDTPAGEAYGGTGIPFDWSLATTFVQKHPEKKVILAGGLTPTNVAEAVRMVRPFAVDVASGVEKSPGQKDFAKLRAFIHAVQSSATTF